MICAANTAGFVVRFGEAGQQPAFVLARRREHRDHQRLQLPPRGVELAEPLGERRVVFRGEQHRRQHEIGHVAGEHLEGGLDAVDGEQFGVPQRTDRREAVGLPPVGLDGQNQKHLTSAS